MPYIMSMPERVTFMLCLCILLPLAAGTRVVAQEATLSSLEEALGTGNARQLGSMMAPAVEITLFGARKRYSRTQARLLMQSFFASWPPAGFEVQDFTKTATGWFIEARYHTSRPGSPLRLYVRLRKQDQTWFVRELIMEAAQHEQP